MASAMAMFSACSWATAAFLVTQDASPGSVMVSAWSGMGVLVILEMMVALMEAWSLSDQASILHLERQIASCVSKLHAALMSLLHDLVMDSN